MTATLQPILLSTYLLRTKLEFGGKAKVKYDKSH